jgi:hypothetical protein
VRILVIFNRTDGVIQDESGFEKGCGLIASMNGITTIDLGDCT